ncbi:hypothetical protein PFFCH_05759, partial [Plasmodium falciparum FCH/4]
MVKQVKPGGNLEDATAKNIFDRIGKKVHEEVKKVAEQYRSQLKGTLSRATFEGKQKDPQTPPNPCELDYQYHTNATNGRSYPCRTGTEKRFSEVSGGECDEKKIKGNKNNCGACAPFRRLNLCVRNLENISNYGKINNDTLLADVCLAALHEGDSIRGDHGQYQQTNSYSQLCTMLARSFADIGDIIRGSDLYRGVNGNDKLEENLKKIFGKIHNGLDGKTLQKRYEGDGPNFFQLREDWWTANRHTVWEALTCDVKDNIYFRATCNGEERTKGYCRCIDETVPTYFDYVPQYLRWFEEWGEEFCRLRKHKLQNAIKICRGDNGKERYCDLNGYDCTRTARGENKRFSNDKCYKCSLPCDHFVHWIDNQKKEFLKQKEKYDKEIKQKDQRTITTTHGTINNIYEKDFYRNLKEHYNDVDEFLKKLNDESICKKPPQVGTETADAANFTNENTGKTFDHTEYCQACPWCGVKEQNGKGKWEAKNDADCAKTKTFTKENTTEIPVLTPDKSQSRILDKYKNFCEKGANGGGQIKNWQCYYKKNEKDDVNGDSNICVLQKDKQNTEEENDRSYNSFFWKWVTEMLIDSIDWRKELKRCTNNKRGKCKNKKCNNDCKCFERWVEEKKNEWEKIVDYFKTQPAFSNQGGPLGPIGYDFALKTLLDVEDILTNIKDGYKEVEGAEHIYQMLEKEKSQESNNAGDTENKNTIDLLIDHEEKEAQNCLQTHQNPCPPQESRGRSENPAGESSHNDDHHDDVHDNDIPRRDLKIEDGAKEVPAVPPGPPDACEIVGEILEGKDKKSNIEDCKHKYDPSEESYPKWDCHNYIDTKYNGACMPPRRQKLCLYYLKELNFQTQTKEEELRKGFVKSAALETFFAWNKYKKDKKKEQKTGVYPGDLDNELKSGTIPDEFKRIMFYTYGDYRDICLDSDISKKEGDVKKAKDKIDEIFPTTNTENKTKRQEWWDTNGPDIWKGMLCALEKIAEIPTKFTDNPSYKYDLVKFSGDNSPTLEKFAQRPQFLRWFTEWGEDFCKQQKKEYKELVAKCNNCDVDTDGKSCNGKCGECKTQCEKYKKWIETWIDNYKKQKERYTKVKGTLLYNEDKDVKNSDDARDYLKTQLKNMTCTNGLTNENCEYTCMDTPSSTNTGNMPESLDDEPKEVNGKCSCREKAGPPPEVREVLKQENNACTTVENLFENDPQKKFKEACAQKYSTRYPGWKCNSGTSKTDKDGGSVCIPPRRQKLYLKHLQELTNGTSEKELRKAFIECAAVETFFSWHKYKQENKTQNTSQLLGLSSTLYFGKDSEDPEHQLKQGTIPDGFLRQMFYTLADYKDILDGKNIVADILNGSSGSDKDMVEREKTIKEKIKIFFEQNGNKEAAPRGSPQTQHSVEKTTRESLWDKIAEH